jgi:PAS domain S-box-containing protein
VSTEQAKVNVLLVDDRRSNMLALESSLHDAGLNLVPAYSGQEALRHLLHDDFAVIILDVQMPGMDGYETATLIRARARSQATPIIFITAASPSETHASQGYSLGAVDYIFRPVEPEILRSKVAVFVELFRKREEIRRQNDELDLRVQQRTAELARANEALQAEIVERQRVEEQRTQLLAREQQARAAAEVAEARYRNLFEGTADAILVVDTAGRCLDANPAATALLGYRRDELLDLGVRALAPCEANGSTETRDGAHFLCSGHWRGEFEARQKGGSVVPVEGQASAVELPTGTVHVVALRDISERRALERMQQDFIAMVSHELQTPLTSLKGWAQILQRKREYQAHAIDTIVNQANRLERLIGDLLAVARLEGGQLDLQRSEVDLTAVTRASAEQAAALTDKHAIRLDVPEEPVTGWWDRDRLAQILANLLSNAVKYSPEGGAVDVQIRRLDEEVVVAVQDHGVGIPAHALPHLFDRFYRVKSTARSTEGLGLGLYITSLLVGAHGGRIWVESAPGEGTTIKFSLPYGQPPSSAAA